MSGMERAEKILADNEELLHKLSKELLEREILDNDEIEKIMRGEELPPAKKNGSVDPSLPKEEGVPEHVKSLLDEKKKRETEKPAEAND